MLLPKAVWLQEAQRPALRGDGTPDMLPEHEGCSAALLKHGLLYSVTEKLTEIKLSSNVIAT